MEISSVVHFIKSKSDVIAKHRLSDNDSGSVFVQIAVLSCKISYLTKHLEAHKHDHSARRSLIMMVEKRRKMFAGAFKYSPEKCDALIADFGLKIKQFNKN